MFIKLLATVFVLVAGTVLVLRLGGCDSQVRFVIPPDPTPPAADGQQASIPIIPARSMSVGLPTRGQWRGKPTLADVNGDGWIDLVAALRRWDRSTSGEGIHVWLGNGKGEWEPYVDGLRRDMGYGGTAVGDIDDDGEPDIAFSGHSVNPHVFLNRGKPAWRPSAVEARLATVCSDVALGDFNQDGKLDMAALGQFPARGGLYVYAGDGKGGFERESQLLEKRHYGAQIRFRDLDQDDRPELVAATSTGPRVWRRKGGAWEDMSSGLPTPEIGGADLAVATADLDGDGHAELLVAGMSFEGHAPMRLYRWSGSEWAQWGRGLPGGEAFYDADFATLSPGSRPSIVAAGKRGITVISMTDPDTFETRGCVQGTAGVLNVCAGEVSGDGQDEIVFAGFGGVRVLDLHLTSRFMGSER